MNNAFHVLVFVTPGVILVFFCCSSFVPWSHEPENPPNTTSLTVPIASIKLQPLIEEVPESRLQNRWLGIWFRQPSSPRLGIFAGPLYPKGARTAVKCTCIVSYTLPNTLYYISIIIGKLFLSSFNSSMMEENSCQNFFLLLKFLFLLKEIV